MIRSIYITIFLLCSSIGYALECRLYTKEEHIIIDEIWVHPQDYKAEIILLNIVDANTPVWSELDYKECPCFFSVSTRSDWLENKYRTASEEDQKFMRSKARCPAVFDKPEKVWYRSYILIYLKDIPLGTYEFCFHAILGSRTDPNNPPHHDYAWLRVNVTENIPPKISLKSETKNSKIKT